MKCVIKATIEIEYTTDYDFAGNASEEEQLKMLELLESGELEIMLDKDMADCVYTDNQCARFDNVEVKEIKAKIKGDDNETNLG